MRNNLYDILGDIRDIERLTSKIAYGSPTPKDLFALGSSLRSLPPIKNMLEYAQSPMLKEIKENIFTLDEIADKLVRAIDDKPPNCS